MAPPLRLLVAGAGAFGREHIVRLARRPDVSLVAVADPNPTALARIRSLTSAELLADPAGMIETHEADGVVIASPADSHASLALLALSRDLGVLLEKPIASSLAEAGALKAKAASTRGLVLPGHTLRFSKDHRRLMDVVRSGEIGAVIYVNSRRYRDDSHAVRYPEVDPVLMTLIHDFDLAQWATGARFASVRARRSEGPGFRSLTCVSAVTTGGVACELRTAWTFPDGAIPPDRLEVVGDRGSVELTVGESLLLHSDGRRADLGVNPDDDALAREHDGFLSCVRDRTLKPALGLDEALAGLALAEAALASLLQDREAPVTA